jgi:hypothetical protein
MNPLLITLAREDQRTQNVVRFAVSSMLDHLLRVSEGEADMVTRQAAVMQLVAEELLKHGSPK